MEAPRHSVGYLETGFWVRAGSGGRPGVASANRAVLGGLTRNVSLGADCVLLGLMLGASQALRLEPALAESGWRPVLPGASAHPLRLLPSLRLRRAARRQAPRDPAVCAALHFVENSRCCPATSAVLGWNTSGGAARRLRGGVLAREQGCLLGVASLGWVLVSERAALGGYL